MVTGAGSVLAREEPQAEAHNQDSQSQGDQVPMIQIQPGQGQDRPHRQKGKTELEARIGSRAHGASPLEPARSKKARTRVRQLAVSRASAFTSAPRAIPCSKEAVSMP
jgi:hypothetical protein